MLASCGGPPATHVCACRYDLLEVGDDVVFGSRTHVLCAGANYARKVTIRDGGNVADRCFLLPGATVERNATLGSGTLAGPDFNAAPGTVWLGSQCGAAVKVHPGSAAAVDEPTLTPFARAFYLKQAPFCVLPEAVQVSWSLLCEVGAAALHAMPLALALSRTNPHPADCSDIGQAIVVVGLHFALWHMLMTAISLALDVGGKWAIVGRPTVGDHSWHKDSYNQRWQLYLSLAQVSCVVGGHKVLHFLGGSIFLVWYFRSLGATVGDRVCLYPNEGETMMTEPNLVTLGDRVCVDQASLICHINSRGVFALRTLVVGSHSTMRSGCRLLSGATMERGSTLLEHTLVLAGDVVTEGSTSQGWPAKTVHVGIKLGSPADPSLNALELQAANLPIPSKADHDRLSYLAGPADLHAACESVAVAEGVTVAAEHKEHSSSKRPVVSDSTCE